jgi:hypothetical protein
MPVNGILTIREWEEKNTRAWLRANYDLIRTVLRLDTRRGAPLIASRVLSNRKLCPRLHRALLNLAELRGSEHRQGGNASKSLPQIAQFDLQGRRIATYANVEVAYQTTRIPIARIQAACKQGRGIAGGFRWAKARSARKIGQYAYT